MSNIVSYIGPRPYVGPRGRAGGGGRRRRSRKVQEEELEPLLQLCTVKVYKAIDVDVIHTPQDIASACENFLLKASQTPTFLTSDKSVAEFYALDPAYGGQPGRRPVILTYETNFYAVVLSNAMVRDGVYTTAQLVEALYPMGFKKELKDKFRMAFGVNMTIAEQKDRVLNLWDDPYTVEELERDFSYRPYTDAELVPFQQHQNYFQYSDEGAIAETLFKRFSMTDEDVAIATSLREQLADVNAARRAGGQPIILGLDIQGHTMFHPWKSNYKTTDGNWHQEFMLTHTDTDSLKLVEVEGVDRRGVPYKIVKNADGDFVPMGGGFEFKLPDGDAAAAAGESDEQEATNTSPHSPFFNVLEIAPSGDAQLLSPSPQEAAMGILPSNRRWTRSMREASRNLLQEFESASD